MRISVYRVQGGFDNRLIRGCGSVFVLRVSEEGEDVVARVREVVVQ